MNLKIGFDMLDLIKRKWRNADQQPEGNTNEKEDAAVKKTAKRGRSFDVFED